MSEGRSEPRVFVVDDETVIATTLAVILRQSGYDAHSFNLPMEALQASRENAPDLLITDVVMPELTGIDLAVQVREHSPKCKILLISGNPATVGLLALAREKGHEFEAIGKPIHPEQLMERIRTTFDS